MTNLSGTHLNRREATGPKGEGKDSPSNFPKYPEYKDSGVEWLGEVPAHWDIKQLKHLVTCLDGQRIPLNGVERHSRQGSVPYWGANKIMDHVDEALFNEELVLLGEDGAPFFDVGRPVAFHSSGPVWPNNHIHVLRPGEADWVKQIVYGLNSTNYIDFVEGSTRDKLTQSRMMSIPLAWPPSEERETITAFLDHETARIDALVEQQQRLIELLKEKRQAVISHAVTKGLDPDVPMKHSGVEWLGEVPTHWEVVPLGLLALKIQTGPFGSQLHSHEYVGGGVPVINPSNIVDGEILPDPLSTVTQEVVERLAHQRLSEGEIVVGRRGEMGRCAVVSSEESGWVCGTGSMKVLLSERADPDFVSMFIRTPLVRGLLKIESVGSTMENLNPEILSRVRAPVPPIAEQRDLVEKVRLTERKTQRLISEALQGSELLQERRSALISAAVTGKIDVRDWTPPAGSSAYLEAVQTEGV